MRRLIVLLLAGVGLAASQGGCTQTHSYKEREHMWQQVVDTDLKQLVEDIDYFLLMDRPTRLSRWHER